MTTQIYDLPAFDDEGDNSVTFRFKIEAPGFNKLLHFLKLCHQLGFAEEITFHLKINVLHANRHFKMLWLA